MNRLPLTLTRVALTLALCACGGGKDEDCPDGFARDNDGNCIELDGGGGGGNEPTNTNENTNPTNEPDGAEVGAACSGDQDCASNICVFQWAYDVLGVCTETCDSWADCSEAFWECCDLSNGGFVCAPNSWVDELGLQCN